MSVSSNEVSPSRTDSPVAGERGSQVAFAISLVGVLVTSAALLSCKGQSTHERRDMTFLPPREIVQGPIDTGTLQSTQDTTHCLRQMPARVVAQGRIRKEVHAGPPGYGETPDQDERDTILVLVLPGPIPVCADPAHGDTVAVVHASALQLVYVPRNALEHLGEAVTVYGRLEEAVFGWHFTSVVLHVDSIPELRVTPVRTHTTLLRTQLSRRAVGRGA